MRVRLSSTAPGCLGMMTYAEAENLEIFELEQIVKASNRIGKSVEEEYEKETQRIKQQTGT